MNYYVTEELLTEVLSQSDQITLDIIEKYYRLIELARIQYEHEKEIELAKI